MSDIRFNQWLHQSGTGGITQVDGGHVGIGTTNPDVAVHSGNTKKINVGIVTANSIYAGSLYGDGSNLTGISGISVANQADNRLITATGTTDALNGEANLTFNGARLHAKGSGEILRLETTASGGGQCYIDFDDETATRASIGMRGSSSDTLTLAALNGSMRFDVQNKTQALNIDSSGRLLLGTTSVGASQVDTFTMETSGHTGMTMFSGTSNRGTIAFGDGRSGNAQYRGVIMYDHSDDSMRFHTSDAERLRINSAGITTFFKVPELDKTPTSGHNSTAGSFGFSVQRSFVRSITAGNVGNFCDYYITEGNAALMIQISSDTGGHSGTATYYWYGGFLPSSGYGDHWHRIFPAHQGYGHGDAADTGFGNSTAWELLIGGAGVTGSNYRIRVACHVPSGKTNKSIVCTITELRRGMQFYDKSGDSLYAFSGQTDSGSDAINRTWANSFVVSNGSDSTNYNYRNMYLSGNQHFYFANGANQAYLHLDGSWVNASDIAYKKDIEDITYGIDTVKQLKPRKYKHKGNNNNDIGFIAQELESVVPEVVSGDDGNKGVSYGNLTATLTKALQELIAKVETLEAKVAALEGS